MGHSYEKRLLNEQLLHSAAWPIARQSGCAASTGCTRVQATPADRDSTKPMPASRATCCAFTSFKFSYLVQKGNVAPADALDSKAIWKANMGTPTRPARCGGSSRGSLCSGGGWRASSHLLKSGAGALSAIRRPSPESAWTVAVLERNYYLEWSLSDNFSTRITNGSSPCAP